MSKVRTVGKTYAAAELAETLPYHKNDLLAILTAYQALILRDLQAGRAVRIHGLGTFKVVERAGAARRVPRTGAVVETPPRLRIKYVQSKTLLGILNGEEAEDDAEDAA